MGSRWSRVLLALLATIVMVGAVPGVAGAYVAPGPGVASGPPEITGVQQPVVRPNGPVVVSGTNLQGATSVTIGDDKAAKFSYTNVQQTAMRVWIPSDYTNGDIVVTTPLGSSVAHIRLFRIDTATPQNSFPGATLTITGQGFNAITQLWTYNTFTTDPQHVEVALDYHVQSDTQMTITVPYTATNNANYYAQIPGYSFPIGTFHMPPTTTCTCIHLASAQTGRRTLDAQPNTTNNIVTNNNPHLAIWNYTFPTPQDQTHGLFQLTSPTTNQCLTAQDTTNLDHTQTPNLQQTPCSTDRGSNLYMRQIWYFVKATDTPANQTFELVSAADGRCTTATADQDNTPTNTAGCTATTTQQWWVLDPDDMLLADAIQHGTILATDLATAKTTATINHRTTIYSAMDAHRPLEMHDDLNNPWYPPTIDNANTIRHWAFGTQSDTDTQNGRFTLIDERHNRNRCLTETPDTYPTTPNNTHTAYPNLIMTACIEIPGSSTENRQHFTLRQINKTQYQIRSTNDNNCLTVPYGADFNNAQVDIEPCNGEYGQLWTFDDTTGKVVAGLAAFNVNRDIILQPKSYPDKSAGFYTDAKNAHYPPALSPFPDPGTPKGGATSPSDPVLLPPTAADDPTQGKYIPYVMDKTTASFNDVFTIKYYSDAERTAGYFQMVDKANGLCLTNMFDFVGAVREADCATNGGYVEIQQQWFFTIPLDGEVWLRSKRDGKCLALNGGGNDKFREVAMVQCHVNTSPDDAVWRIIDADPTDAVPVAQGLPTLDPNAATESGYALADGSNKQIAEKGPYSTNVLSVGDCESFTLPAGQGITAVVSLYEYDAFYFGQYSWLYPPGMNGTEKRNIFPTSAYDSHPITVVSVGAPYTNTTFNMYGTTCDPYYTIDSSADTLSAAGTGLAEQDAEKGCGGEGNGAFATYMTEAAEDWEDLTDLAGEFFAEIYPLMARL